MGNIGNDLVMFGYEVDRESTKREPSRKLIEEQLDDMTDQSVFGFGFSQNKISWQGIYATPIIRLEDVGYVYCIEPDKSAPNGHIYNEGVRVEDAGVKALLQAGFPQNSGNLSKQEAYVRTFVALNAYLGTFNQQMVKSYGDPYVNEMLTQAAKPAVQSIGVRVVEPSNVAALYNEQTKRIETDLYEVTGNKGDFWVEGLPKKVYAINEKGERKDKFPAGNKFRIVSEDLELNQDISFEVKTKHKDMQLVRYESKGVQNLLTLEEKYDVVKSNARAVIRPRIVHDLSVKKKPSQPIKPTPVSVVSKRPDRPQTLVKTGASVLHIVIGFVLCFASVLVLIGQQIRIRFVGKKRMKVK